MTNKKEVVETIKKSLNELTSVSGIHFNGENAVKLMIMTSAHESLLFEHKIQIGGGPARGIFQMEPPTYYDTWKNVINIRPKLKNALKKMNVRMNSSNLMNDRHATIIGRIQYYRFSEAIPDANDLWSLAAYAKKYWNTQKGKATVNDYYVAFQKLMDIINQDSHKNTIS